MPKYKQYTIYGDYFDHPNGYQITDLLVLKFESGPSLQKDEKLKLIEHRALVDVQNKLDKILDYCEPHIEQMWAALVCSLILECDFRDVKEKLKQFRQEIERGEG